MPRFRNRFFYLLLLNLFFALGLKAQQEPYFSTYFTNPGIVNPSLSSTFDNSNVTLIYRSQWSGYTPTNLYSSDNSPNTGILSLNLKSRDKLYSFGFNLISDNLGPKETFIFSPYIAIKKKLSNSNLSFSLSPNFKSSTMNFNSVVFVTPADPFNVGGRQTQSKPDLGLGLSYYNTKFLLSIGVNNITQPSFNIGIDDLVNKDLIDFSFLGKYLIQIDRDLNFEPFLLVRSDLKSFTFDISGMITYQENMNIGLSYRYDEAIVGFLGYSFLKKRKLFVGYSFDYVLHNVDVKAATSHELVLRYDLPTPQLKKPIRTPRFIY